ncbi:uncharacterized protein LOC112343688 [Selaginella moellendorffii]|uniref:uncharacterized protein LOC112343688 n=1 Tax=Selaginella moellendorffii TaxID=88036 RepID=UPI000D1CC634|nr:uncharacterized protein LOC112343688 [Selaginella moellendorffii]|eukprot:XP_024523391.1 uncharacterized protein LOC112343688 [Selaginella moellendorffii]
MALPGFFRKVLNHLGFKKEGEDGRRRDGFSRGGGGGGGGGFSTRMAMPAPGSTSDGGGPVVSQCNYGNGGVQLLRADEDGDVAQEFLQESRDHRKRLRLELVDTRTKPVKLKGPLCALDGSVHQFVELAGEIYWA